MRGGLLLLGGSGDGLSDGDEVNATVTNPLDPDTDGDGQPDGQSPLEEAGTPGA